MKSGNQGRYVLSGTHTHADRFGKIAQQVRVNGRVIRTGMRSMDNPEANAFERIDDIAICRIVGQYTISISIELIRERIAQAYEQRISKLMVVITETSGYEVPSLAMRMVMMREWADAACGFVRPAIVCRREFIDPGKFGIPWPRISARNRCFRDRRPKRWAGCGSSGASC